MQAILLASVAILPQFLQSLLGYSAFTSGMAIMPRGCGALIGIAIFGSLSKIIDNKEEIDVSSKYEVEIRASQIVVIDYIKSKIKNVNSIDINDYLFLYSKKVKNIVKPYHLCRNVNY